MLRLLESLRRAYPQLKFSAGETFYWSPETQEVFYKPNAKEDNKSRWSLLHETGHALLGHQTYERDLELLRMEMAAWEKARELAQQLKVTIDEEHIQDCLDTYRDWLNARSVCPGCTTKSFQQTDPRFYRCHNCHTIWQVTPARFTRAYRSVKNTKQTVFATEI